MQVSSSNQNNFLPPLMRQAGETNKGQQKALPSTPQAPMPSPSATANPLQAMNSMKQLQQQRIHASFAAIAGAEGSSGSIEKASNIKNELLKRLEGEQKNSDKISLEAGPLAGGWRARRSNRSQTERPLNWQGLQSHSEVTNGKLLMLVVAISEAANDNVGPHVSVTDLNSNEEVMEKLRDYVVSAQQNNVQPHSLRNILTHLIVN